MSLKDKARYGEEWGHYCKKFKTADKTICYPKKDVEEAVAGFLSDLVGKKCKDYNKECITYHAHRKAEKWLGFKGGRK